jgi:anthranilate phosphoribosyltransferase
MNILRTLQALTHGGPGPAEAESAQLLGALLDDGLPELEQGALLALLEVRPLGLPALIGFHRALGERCFRLVPPAGLVRPVLLATHCAHDRSEANLLPLLALLLQRLGMTVLVHGSLEGAGVGGSAHVFRDLGVMPCSSLTQVQQQLDRNHLAFVPTAVIAPGLARLMARRARLDCGRLTHLLQRMLDPYAGQALAVVATGCGPDARMLPSLFRTVGARALRDEGPEGEPFACPHRRPALELAHESGRELLFASGPGMQKPRMAGADAGHAADWTRRALRGEVPLPVPVVNQVACCLYGAGYASDINQAKAIAALETGSLVTA